MPRVTWTSEFGLRHLVRDPDNIHPYGATWCGLGYLRSSDEFGIDPATCVRCYAAWLQNKDLT